MATTKQQTADSRVQRMSTTAHLPAASPQPTPRVTSRATSTSRGWRNHSQRLGNTALLTQPHSHPCHRPSIPSCFYKPNLRSNTSRYRKSWCRMQVSWQPSPRVAVAAMAAAAAAAAAEAKAAAASAVVGTKPYRKRKHSAPTATRWSSTTPRSVSPSRRTRTNTPRDGAPNAGNDRDRGPKIMTQY